ncbi:hypothetical protein CDAR_212891 [Caerostris darwini]|uniref:Uncharacterized protein n=1 Tax=Caerostris darwini TaxID=1538125 RepID=A0AAV4MEC5_9ARAC|nr:hypothetical protein CDAR_212891 [Caerostris darwini]
MASGAFKPSSASPLSQLWTRVSLLVRMKRREAQLLNLLSQLWTEYPSLPLHLLYPNYGLESKERIFFIPTMDWSIQAFLCIFFIPTMDSSIQASNCIFFIPTMDSSKGFPQIELKPSSAFN